MSCDVDGKIGCYALGLMERKNKDYVSARKLLNKSCNNGLNEACVTLEKMTLLGR